MLLEKSRAIASRLVRVLNEIEARGVDWEGRRFGVYRDALLAFETGPTPKLLRQFGEDGCANLLFEASTQSQQLMMAAPALKYLESKSLVRTLKKIMAGDPLPPEGHDDLPRNTLLELVAARHALDLGFQIVTSDSDEDIAVEYPGLGRGAIECKRPFTDKTLLPNLNKIGDQLRKREKMGSKYGIAAIGIDRITQLSQDPIRVEATVRAQNEAASRLLFDEVDRIHALSLSAECRLVPPAMIGVVVLAAATYIDRSRAMRPFCQVARFPLVDPSTLPPDLEAILRRRPDAEP